MLKTKQERCVCVIHLMKRLIRIFGIAMLVIYLAGCSILYVAQEEVLFRPSPLSPNTSFRFGEEVLIEVAEGISLHALYPR